MKRLFTLAFLFISALGIAQHPVSLFKTELNSLPEQINTDLNPHIRQYTLLQPEQSVWTTLLAERPQTLMLTLPFEGGMTLELEKTNPLAHDFILTASNASGSTDTLDYEPGLHYKGKIAGAAQSLVAISIFEDQIMGVISDAQSNINLGRVNTDAARASNMYVMFRDKELVNPQGFACGTPDDPDVNLPVDIARSADFTPNDLPVNSCPIRVFLDCDYSLYLTNGGNTSATMNMATANFNVSKIIFSNENVAIEISEIHVWTSNDPFSNTVNTKLSLGQFRDYYFPLGGVNGNIGMLLQPDNVGGRAWIDVICSNSLNYGICGNMATPNPYPNWTFGVKALTHELGHNFGSAHTQYCGWPGGAIDNCWATEPICQDCPPCPPGPPPVNGGTIMSYCEQNPPYSVPLANGFGPMPGWVIRDRAANAGCIFPLNDYWNEPTVCGCTPDPADVQNLVNLFENTNGWSWTNKANWLNYNNFNWYGVRWVKIGNKCKVRYISLHENNLSGQVPNLNLPELQRLILDKNHLTGQIPAFSLPKLFALQLDTNSLSGSIPTFNLPELWYLDLTTNNLTGSIPSFNYPKLEYLWVADNQLTGTIPNFNLPKLKSIWFAYNQLSGGIPNFNFPDLEYLGFQGNQLSGSIPNFNLPNLGRMVLWSNHFSGSIPNFNLPKLFYLDLSYNQLSGPVPNFNVPNMRYFYLGYNSTLNGTIPNFNFPDVRGFWLAGNQFTGQIPAFNFPKVTYFGLHQNQLTGTIPAQNLPNADSLRFDYNNLTFNGLYQFFPNNRSYFLYTSQAKIPTHTTPNCNTLYVRAGGVTAHNTYKWYKVGTGLISTIVGDSLFTPASAGQYYCEVTNSIVTGLTLTSETVQKGAAYVAIAGTTAICAGGNTVLNAGSGYSTYQWNTGANTQQITAVTAGTYTVTVSIAPGCTGTAQTIVTSTSFPQPVIQSSSPSICSGSATVTLNAGSGYNAYLWSNGKTTQTIDVTQASNYQVTVTNGPGCTGSASITLTANTPATPVISGIMPICPGQNLTLSAGNFASYHWSTGSTSSSATINQPGNYTVTVSNAAGCTGTATALIPTNTLNLTIQGNADICIGGFTALTATNGFTAYQWSTGETTQAIEIDSQGFYSVTVSSALGCTGTAMIEIATASIVAPQVSIQGLTTVCNANSTILNAGSGYSSYKWSNGSTTQNINVTQSGNYGVSVTDANGCTGKDQVSVNFGNTPTVQITGPASICNGSTTTLTASAGLQQYIWSTGQSSSTINVSQAGTYTVTVSNQSGCTASATINISNQGNSTVVITPAPSGFATPYSGGVQAYSITPVAGAASYTWTPPPGASINGQPAGQAVTLPAATGTSVSVAFDCGWGDLCVQATGNCIQSTPACKSINFYNNVYTDIPLCNQTVPGGDEIHLACIYTDLNGLHGSNIGYTIDPGPIGFCGTVETGVWYGFVATTNAMTFTVTPTSTILNNGLQLALTDREGNSLVCDYGEINSFPLPSQVSYDSLMPGKVYYLFVESFGGDECNYIISTTPSANHYLLPSLGTISPAIQGPSSICPGASVVMSIPPVDNALQYSWQGPAGTLFNGNPWPVYLGPEGHTVTVTFANTSGPVAVLAANGCDYSSLSTKQVNVGALPPTILPSIVVCNEEAPYITPWGDEVFTSGTYQTTLTANSGCDSIVRQTVVIKPPIHTILPPKIICHGESVTICGQTYATTGYYMEQCQSWQGCDSVVTLNLTVFDVVAKITGGSVICSGLPLTIGSLPSIGQKVWKNGSGQTLGFGSQLSVVQPGTYILTVSSSPCIAYDTINVTESNGAPPTIATFGGVITCLSPTLTIGATSTTQGLAYEWYGPNGFTASQQFINVSAEGYYVVKATTPEGCSDVDTALVSLEPVFNIDLNIVTEPSGLTCQATAIPSAGEPPLTYIWSNGQTTQTATGILPGPFAVTIIDVLGCSATTTGECMSVGTAQPDAPEVFTVQPNPASDLLTIQVKMQQEARISLRLINALGQVVFENNYQAQEFEEVINARNLTPGCYFLQLNNGQYRKAIIVSIIR
ncbi:MAG: T9SS type A sorting domain-containing protein [Saprospiraceae bacterium]|nr:T9SS type A sorting domain-containing protein [Saprospiraceae bacterium]